VAYYIQMNRLLTPLAVAGAFFGAAVSSIAQANQEGKSSHHGRQWKKDGTQINHRAERAKVRQARMTQTLELSPAQQDRLQAIHRQYSERLSALRKAGGVPRTAAIRDQYRQIRQQRRDAMLAVLNPAQRAKMDEMRKQNRERAGERSGKSGKGWKRSGKGMSRSVPGGS
jgi:Spy/CpxP family protein refolding chaperone